MIRILLRILTNGSSRLDVNQCKKVFPLLGSIFFFPRQYADFKCINSLFSLKKSNQIFHKFFTDLCRENKIIVQDSSVRKLNINGYLNEVSLFKYLI